MSKIIDAPETVADMIALLRKLPANAKLLCYIVEDNRGLSEAPSYKIKVEHLGDMTFLTFSNGSAISDEQ